jgi:hypothetical protein
MYDDQNNLIYRIKMWFVIPLSLNNSDENWKSTRSVTFSFEIETSPIKWIPDFCHG